MINVRKVDFGHKRERIYEDDNCSGCNREIEEGEEIRMIKMPFEDYDKYIALCMKCYGSAKKQGAL